MFLGATLTHALRTVRTSKRILLAAGFVDLLICLPPAVYLLRQVHGGAAHRADALDVARRLSSDFFADLRNRTSGFDDDLTALVVVSIVVFFFVRPFLAGGYVGLAASEQRSTFGRFAKEGGRAYFRLLFLGVIAALTAYLLSIAAKPLLVQVDEWALTRSENAANRYRLVTNLVVVGGFAVAAVIFDHTRVGLRLNRDRGVLAELGRSALFVLQHPGRTLLLFALSVAAELGVVWAGGALVQIADGGYLTTSAIVLVTMQAVVTLREAARLFHLAGAWQLRAAEQGDEPKEPLPVTPEPELPDVLRSPLPWNVR